MRLGWGLALSPKQLFNVFSFYSGENPRFLKATGYTWPHVTSCDKYLQIYHASNIIILTRVTLQPFVTWENQGDNCIIRLNLEILISNNSCYLLVIYRQLDDRAVIKNALLVNQRIIEKIIFLQFLQFIYLIL